MATTTCFDALSGEDGALVVLAGRRPRLLRAASSALASLPLVPGMSEAAAGRDAPSEEDSAIAALSSPGLVGEAVQQCLSSLSVCADVVQVACHVASPLVGALGASATFAGVGLSLSHARTELLEGRQEELALSAHGARIAALLQLYGEEPETPAKREALAVLEEQAEVVCGCRDQARSHCRGQVRTKLAGNAVSVASSLCMAAAPATLGATGLVAFSLGLGSAAVLAHAQVADSWRGFELRHGLLQAVEAVWRSQVRYAKATGRLPYPEQPHEFHFSVPGVRWCQFYMTVEYTASDGSNVVLLSCDQDEYNWYGASISVDPAARDIRVSFDVRGGRQLHAVDRALPGRPWCTDEQGRQYREVFEFTGQVPVRASFALQGTSCHAWVDSAVY